VVIIWIYPSEIFDIDRLPDLVEYIVGESLYFMGLDYRAPIYLPPFRDR